MPDLDKNRPYGTIYGPGPHGAMYEQDGMYFDGEGKCLSEKPAEKVTKKRIKADDQIAKQLHG